MTLTQKETSLLSDLKSQEQLCIDKYQRYSDEACDGLQGMIGVVGPTRMDYAKVTARLSYFAESLSKMFGKSEQPSLPEGKEK